MDGFLCIDKPRGPSSFQIVNRIRHALSVSKAGHAGTLDPQASGVLVVALGFATRLLRFFLSEPKVYSFKVQFGSQTDTLDSEGKLIHSGGRIPDRLEIEEVIGEFTGKQMQVPPDFSAVKVNGIRAYKLARDGKKVMLQARPIKIFSFQMTEYNAETGIGEFLVRCSGGTYIRTLAGDISSKLGTFGYATEIRRLAVGQFSIESSIDPQDLSDVRNYIISPSELFRSYPVFHAPADRSRYIKNGMDIDIKKETDSDVVFAYCENVLIAVLQRKEGTVFHPVTVLPFEVNE